jgi:pimeloyl-ACP methyl ester carboxylesterase
LTLRGIYYEYSPEAPVELLFHGYQGTAERDLAAGVERCFALGRSVILIDQRGAGKSDGHVVSFGIKERKDCLTWIEFALQKFEKDKKLIIGGISMGAATVMLASGENLPENVVCVMADCGYSSAKEIIKKVVREMHLPADLVYPFIKLGAKIFGGFDLDETTPLEAVQRSKTPLILIHGDADDFVPYQMSADIFEVCPTQKRLVKIKGAGHGLAYPVDSESYVNALREFQEECGF